METLIGILMYIGAVTVDVPYTTSEIYQIETNHQEMVNTIEEDPHLLLEVEYQFSPFEIESDGGDKLVIDEIIDL